jgi:hypothetical protein
MHMIVCRDGLQSKDTSEQLRRGWEHPEDLQQEKVELIEARI